VPKKQVVESLFDTDNEEERNSSYIPHPASLIHIPCSLHAAITIKKIKTEKTVPKTNTAKPSVDINNEEGRNGTYQHIKSTVSGKLPHTPVPLPPKCAKRTTPQEEDEGAETDNERTCYLTYP
jgi:hypothetical protein